MNDIERFWSKVEKSEFGCWIWTGSMVYGYGQIRFNGKSARAHRISWSLANGTEIPNGMFVCHSCDNRACVRPDHLWIGDAAANAQDCVSKGRHWVQNNPDKSPLLIENKRRKASLVCKRGHPREGENVYYHSDGHRECVACMKMRERARYTNIDAAREKDNG